MPGEDGGARDLQALLAALEQRLLDHPGQGIDAGEARFLIGALRAQAALAEQHRAERDAACRALLQDWPDLPELGPAEIEDLLDQLGLVAETEGEEGRTLRLTARGAALLGLADDEAPAAPPMAPDLVAICRALGLGTVMRSPEALRALAEALLAAASERLFWPPEDDAGEASSPSP